MKRIFGFLLLSVFLFSCSDSIDSHGSNFLLNEKPYILKGSVKSSDKEELSGRMAIPAILDVAEYLSNPETYKFEVWHDGILHEDVIVVEGGNFSLQLKTGDNQIKIKVKKKINGTSSVCILESCENITIGANSPHVLSKNFVLKKLQTEGKTGSVKLSINCSGAGVGYVTATLVETDSTKISNWQNALAITDGTLILELNADETTVQFPSSGDFLSINSGSYRVKFDFYDNYDNKNILYSRIQTIEVYDGLVTDKWYEAGVGQPGPVETFTVNGEAVSAFVNATVYVDPVNGDDDNGGSYYGKFKTLQKALNTVDARNKKINGEEFNIFLSGDFTDQDPVFLNQESGVLKLNIKSDSDTQRVITGKSGQSSSALFKINGRAADDTIINLENIRITGQTNTSDSGNGGGIYVKRATLTLTKCTIVSNSANKGGGIYIDSGIVKLGNGSKITGNTATDSGGGVYNKGNFFMYGSSLIGDSATSTTLASDSSGGYANKAKDGGGIYNNNGYVYIGYDSAEHEYPIESGTNTWYGIRRNLSTSDGAGIYHLGGTLKIASGDISYNFAKPSETTYGGAVYINAGATISGGTFTGNHATYGGAFYISSNKKFEITGNAVITSNTAVSEGGAIYNSGTLEMSAGTIGASGALNTISTSDSGNGGAIYQNGTFKMSGSAKVYGSRLEKSNDVYLPSGKYITIDQDSFTGSAPITPYSWKRGTQVLDGSYASSFLNKFSPIDGEWHVVSDSSVGKLDTEDAEIYVSESKLINATGYYTGDDTTGRGTQTRPYATIQRAVKETWKASDYTIYVNGTLTATSAATGDGKGNLQNIPDNILVKATSITLSGSNSATINANSKGSVLTISKAIPVTITNIKITGGSAANGGGLYVGAGTVKLGTGAVVTGNQASSYGGGVYIASGASLFMYGSAIVGDKITYTATSDTLTTSGTTGCANAAGTYGGGIYNLGNLYLGYSSWTNGSGSTNPLTGGVRRNYAKVTGSLGGGIYSTGTMYIASGNISYNCNENNGGGIYAGGSTNEITGAITMESNKATAGGGAITVAGSKTLKISGAEKPTFTSNSSNNGGAIINNGTLTITANAIFEKNTGNNAGGAIYNAGALTMSAGTIGTSGNLNTAGTGGGVYHTGSSFSIYSSASVYAGNGAGSNDVYVASGKTISPSASSWSGSLVMTPGTYDATSTYIGGSYVSNHYSKISVTPQGSESDTINWITTTAGKIAKGVRVTVADALTVLETLPSGSMLAVTGSITADQVTNIGSKMNELYLADENMSFALDLTGTTGLTTIKEAPLNKGFYNCKALTSIALPTTVTSLETRAFAYGYNIVSMTGLDNVGSVGEYTFSCCKFTSFDFKKTKLKGDLSGANYLFQRCNKLQSISIPKEITKFGAAWFSFCSSLETVTFENGSQIKEIPDLTFDNCSELKSITLPSGLEKIGKKVFQSNSRLTELVVPASVTEIGEYLFQNCASRQVTIKYRGTEAQWNAITKADGWNKQTSAGAVLTVKADIVYNYNN